MNELLITPAEVIDLAFAGEEYTPESIVRTSHILTAQQEYLRPVIGGLYEPLCQGEYADLLDDYLKAPLAHYIRALLVEELAVVITPQGVVQSQSSYALPASQRQSDRVRKQALRMANSLIDRATEYIESNSDSYPEYCKRSNVRNHLSLRGGVALGAHNAHKR